ncbi:hypothetical protein HHI36_018872, partial [Cryptolaemus montrouzieri]
YSNLDICPPVDFINNYTAYPQIPRCYYGALCIYFGFYSKKFKGIWYKMVQTSEPLLMDNCRLIIFNTIFSRRYLCNVLILPAGRDREGYGDGGYGGSYGGGPGGGGGGCSYDSAYPPIPQQRRNFGSGGFGGGPRISAGPGGRKFQFQQNQRAQLVGNNCQ